ncbi:MAG: malate:quinone oxidoreductase [Peptococcaceae bacterium]|nr:malate:quinone oxidoreductase [Peptococcaceae bacterium]MBQ2448528.1 malate:quinone oxidoreductase [Peptococcaceae bacterium]MBQ5857689.1 malate:quinone oxidoreductase [Peptococcaceae bacterium]
MAKQKKADVVLVGAGVMSATLGTLIKELEPEWNIVIVEKLGAAGMESTDPWNNAGTGHSALCELNYSVEKSDGTMDVSKAIKINEQFQVSRQFWSYLVNSGQIDNPQDFIMPIPHMSFIEGKKNVDFLRKRYAILSENPLFEGMEYTEDAAKLKEWVPLMMEGRTGNDPIAATRIENGTDVNFGALTAKLIDNLSKKGVTVHYNTTVKDVSRNSDGQWDVKIRSGHHTETVTARFVFLGAGGGSLPLLQKSGISEGKGIGGFPISGLFMVCKNPEVVKEHHAKVYSKAKVGAPPMSVPHLDTRYIDGEESLLFGPFAGFSPKFLKTGSFLDLPLSVKPHNLATMLLCGLKELGLVKYLVGQLMLNDEARLKDLQNFVPNAKLEDWDLIVAGQRVQVIKPKGILQFGTEVVCAADGSIAALLGASPGASVAVDVMLKLLERCFPQEFPQWDGRIKEMIPTYGISLEKNPDLLKQVQASTAATLKLQ